MLHSLTDHSNYNERFGQKKRRSFEPGEDSLIEPRDIRAKAPTEEARFT